MYRKPLEWFLLDSWEFRYFFFLIILYFTELLPPLWLASLYECCMKHVILLLNTRVISFFCVTIFCELIMYHLVLYRLSGSCEIPTLLEKTRCNEEQHPSRHFLQFVQMHPMQSRGSRTDDAHSKIFWYRWLSRQAFPLASRVCGWSCQANWPGAYSLIFCRGKRRGRGTLWWPLSKPLSKTGPCQDSSACTSKSFPTELPPGGEHQYLHQQATARGSLQARQHTQEQQLPAAHQQRPLENSLRRKPPFNAEVLTLFETSLSSCF